MPPRCCKGEAIPLEHVNKLYDSNFKKKWNRKYQEFNTKNRIYCPARRCGEWIKPSQMHVDTSNGPTYGRKYGVCKKCKTRVCCLCNNKWHSSRDCPKDAATREFIKLAKEKGWQKCYNCKATVELKEGCNHMTCACKAEFCMCCGLKWKTCDCQMFSDEAIVADRVAHMGEMLPPNPAAAERAYRQRRHEQELRDEEIARRMQELGLNDGFDEFIVHTNFGNAGANHMHEDFVRRAADALSAVLNPLEDARELYQGRYQADFLAQPQYPMRPRSPAFEHYNNNRAPGRQNERIVPRRSTTNYVAEAEVHRPIPGEARASLLAGMARGQVGQGRVDAWRRHVSP